ncbi:GNAT family N-acetyltransferase [Erwinia endophytica]|uniref:GNAT family N-acetyltransferase n=1 Tax=Erwinia endophytica TaxID=1563158 RepID=UPI001265DBC4|nr:GNAT family N-acetyltransferase [Erwinia endophytica]KAB8313106.1 GNAT family N-acetyltransferase [Erwinia endophytica]
MNHIHYQCLDASQATAELTSLVHVLSACVAQDASVGFISLDPQPMRTFWQGVVSSLASGEQQLLVARQNGTLVGTVIVGLGMMPNGQHRAEIAKLLVHPHARRQGIARALLDGAEALARQAGRTLLVLDTRSGDVAEHIYRRAGWQVSGQIPRYALSPAGVLDATTVMYKFLSPA